MHKTVDTRYTQERELSWLRFDSRVLTRRGMRACLSLSG